MHFTVISPIEFHSDPKSPPIDLPPKQHPKGCTQNQSVDHDADRSSGIAEVTAADQARACPAFANQSPCVYQTQAQKDVHLPIRNNAPESGVEPDLFINIRFPVKKTGKRRDSGYA